MASHAPDVPADSHSWVVTGAGLISAAGDTPHELYSALRDGLPLAGDPPPSGALPIDFEPKRYVDRKGLKDISRVSQLACAAASQLRAEMNGLPAEEIGVVFGSAWASLDTVVRFERETHLEGPRFVDPVLFTETVPNVPAGQLSIFFGWAALNATVAGDTAAGVEALARAIEFLEESRARVVVAGGGDELSPHLLRTLEADGKLARPDGQATGLLGGEGACVFTLESRASAAERGSRILGRIRGTTRRFVQASSGAPGVAEAAALEELLGDCGLDGREIDLIVLSANGEPERDRTEAAAVRATFGESGPPVVAPKIVLGETWAAGGPIGLLVALASMRHEKIPAAPRNIARAPGLRGLDFPPAPLARRVRNALVLDCSGTGSVAGLVVSREE